MEVTLTISMRAPGQPGRGPHRGPVCSLHTLGASFQKTRFVWRCIAGCSCGSCGRGSSGDTHPFELRPQEETFLTDWHQQETRGFNARTCTRRRACTQRSHANSQTICLNVGSGLLKWIVAMTNTMLLLLRAAGKWNELTQKSETHLLCIHYMLLGIITKHKTHTVQVYFTFWFPILHFYKLNDMLPKHFIIFCQGFLRNLSTLSKTYLLFCLTRPGLEHFTNMTMVWWIQFKI